MTMVDNGGTGGQRRTTVGERRRLLIAVVLCGAVAIWLLASGPVLLRMPFLRLAHRSQCMYPEEYWGGTVIMNPVRSRAPERSAESFLGARSRGECPPGML